MPTGLVKSVEISPDKDWVKAVLVMTLGEIISMDARQLDKFCEENIFNDASDDEPYTLENATYRPVATGSCSAGQYLDDSFGVEVFADLV